MSRAAWFGNEPEIIRSIRKRIALAKRQRLASVGRNPEGHDRETGHGRNDEHAIGAAETPSTKSGAPE